MDFINIYVNDKLIGEASYGVKRSDVIKVHKEYNNVNCGFSAIISLKNKEPGTLKLKVELVSQSGVKSWREVSICSYYEKENNFDNKVISDVITLNKLGDTINKISFSQKCIDCGLAQKSDERVSNLESGLRYSSFKSIKNKKM